MSRRSSILQDKINEYSINTTNNNMPLSTPPAIAQPTTIDTTVINSNIDVHSDLQSVQPQQQQYIIKNCPNVMNKIISSTFGLQQTSQINMLYINDNTDQFTIPTQSLHHPTTNINVDPNSSSLINPLQDHLNTNVPHTTLKIIVEPISVITYNNNMDSSSHIMTKSNLHKPVSRYIFTSRETKSLNTIYPSNNSQILATRALDHISTPLSTIHINPDTHADITPSCIKKPTIRYRFTAYKLPHTKTQDFHENSRSGREKLAQSNTCSRNENNSRKRKGIKYKFIPNNNVTNEQSADIITNNPKIQHRRSLSDFKFDSSTISLITEDNNKLSTDLNSTMSYRQKTNSNENDDRLIQNKSPPKPLPNDDTCIPSTYHLTETFHKSKPRHKASTRYRFVHSKEKHREHYINHEDSSQIIQYQQQHVLNPNINMITTSNPSPFILHDESSSIPNTINTSHSSQKTLTSIIPPTPMIPFTQSNLDSHISATNDDNDISLDTPVKTSTTAVTPKSPQHRCLPTPCDDIEFSTTTPQLCTIPQINNINYIHQSPAEPKVTETLGQQVDSPGIFIPRPISPIKNTLTSVYSKPTGTNNAINHTNNTITSQYASPKNKHYISPVKSSRLKQQRLTTKILSTNPLNLRNSPKNQVSLKSNRIQSKGKVLSQRSDAPYDRTQNEHHKYLRKCHYLMLSNPQKRILAEHNIFFDLQTCNYYQKSRKIGSSGVNIRSVLLGNHETQQFITYNQEIDLLSVSSYFLRSNGPYSDKTSSQVKMTNEYDDEFKLLDDLDDLDLLYKQIQHDYCHKLSSKKRRTFSRGHSIGVADEIDSINNQHSDRHENLQNNSHDEKLFQLSSSPIHCNENDNNKNSDSEDFSSLPLSSSSSLNYDSHSNSATTESQSSTKESIISSDPSSSPNNSMFSTLTFNNALLGGSDCDGNDTTARYRKQRSNVVSVNNCDNMIVNNINNRNFENDFQKIDALSLALQQSQDFIDLDQKSHIKIIKPAKNDNDQFDRSPTFSATSSNHLNLGVDYNELPDEIDILEETMMDLKIFSLYTPTIVNEYVQNHPNSQIKKMKTSQIPQTTSKAANIIQTNKNCGEYDIFDHLESFEVDDDGDLTQIIKSQVKFLYHGRINEDDGEIDVDTASLYNDIDMINASGFEDNSGDYDNEHNQIGKVEDVFVNHLIQFQKQQKCGSYNNYGQAINIIPTQTSNNDPKDDKTINQNVGNNFHENDNHNDDTNYDYNSRLQNEISELFVMYPMETDNACSSSSSSEQESLDNNLINIQSSEDDGLVLMALAEVDYEILTPLPSQSLEQPLPQIDQNHTSTDNVNPNDNNYVNNLPKQYKQPLNFEVLLSNPKIEHIPLTKLSYDQNTSINPSCNQSKCFPINSTNISHITPLIPSVVSDSNTTTPHKPTHLIDLDDYYLKNNEHDVTHNLHVTYTNPVSHDEKGLNINSTLELVSKSTPTLALDDIRYNNNILFSPTKPLSALATLQYQFTPILPELTKNARSSLSSPFVSPTGLLTPCVNDPFCGTSLDLSTSVHSPNQVQSSIVNENASFTTNHVNDHITNMINRYTLTLRGNNLKTITTSTKSTLFDLHSNLNNNNNNNNHDDEHPFDISEYSLIVPSYDDDNCESQLPDPPNHVDVESDNMKIAMTTHTSPLMSSIPPLTVFQTPNVLLGMQYNPFINYDQTTSRISTESHPFDTTLFFSPHKPHLSLHTLVIQDSVPPNKEYCNHNDPMSPTLRDDVGGVTSSNSTNCEVEGIFPHNSPDESENFVLDWLDTSVTSSHIQQNQNVDLDSSQCDPTNFNFLNHSFFNHDELITTPSKPAKKPLDEALDMFFSSPILSRSQHQYVQKVVPSLSVLPKPQLDSTFVELTIIPIWLLDSSDFDIAPAVAISPTNPLPSSFIFLSTMMSNYTQILIPKTHND